MASPTRAYRAGESLEDFCRACKTDRMHTVIVVDGTGLPIRVSCGFCHIGPHPLNPPANPEEPEWKNLSGVIGGQ